jgi:mRNA-degrading endonuclease RelE of RelBE toxin-antitoxin system
MYSIVVSKECEKQLLDLDNKSKRILKDKLNIAKENPFHFKRLTGFNKPTFRIRFSDNLEKRLIYILEDNLIKLICILDRKKDYKDLDKYLSK